jgi:broad specificity phosphatase PhoE
VLCLPPGGEPLDRVQARVLRAVDRIAAAHPDGEDVLVVSHGGVISALLAHWLGMPLSSIWRLAVANCSLTEIAVPRVISMNETGHLRDVSVVITEPMSP